MKKVCIELTVRLILNQDEDVETSEIINELDYNFKDTTGKADIIDAEFLDYDIKDSK